jgi:hypothetical protein
MKTDDPVAALPRVKTFETRVTQVWRERIRKHFKNKASAGVACQIFSCAMYQNMKTIPNDQKDYPTTKNIPNGHNVFKHFLFQGPPKFLKLGVLVCIYS